MISLAIVAHPKRSEHVNAMARRLEPVLAAVSWDDQSLGAEKNHLRAWELLSHGDHAWSVVLEDDAVPCENFLHQLEMVLQASPGPVVGLYLGRGRPLTVDGFDWPNRIAAGITKEVCFLSAPGLASCVGVAIRTELIPSMLKSVPALTREVPIDTAIGRWAKGLGHDVVYSRPSLVDHRGVPTLIKQRRRKDGQPRDGYTQLGNGKKLHQVRKAWLYSHTPTRKSWDSTVHPL